MGLREFFRRHRNVFSVTNEWVDAGTGDVETIEEEYGEQATETVNGNRPLSLGWWYRLRSARTSVDGVLEIGDDPADTEKTRS
jgi:hypothetical protein